MEIISKDFQLELQRRVSDGTYASVEQLLREALVALDDKIRYQAARGKLEEELRRGLEGEDTEMTPAEWDAIEQEAMAEIQTREAR
jgi:Arc/MetJ-type ribon-helix-helix transcriptional regulator